jgi:hypothetical protein
VVFSESRKLKEHEILYATHNLEMEAIVHSFFKNVEALPYGWKI